MNFSKSYSLVKDKKATTELKQFLELHKNSKASNGGKNIHVRSSAGKSALMYAAECGNAPVVKLLLEAGARVNLRHGDTTYRGFFWSELLLACKNGYVEIVRTLLTASPKADINERRRGWTPLGTACANGHLEVVQVLLTASPKANINALNSKKTALTYACANGHAEVVRELLRPRTSSKIKRGANLLVLACENGHLEVVRELLDCRPRINVNAQFKEWMPLMAACLYGHLDITQELLKHNKIKIDKKSGDGYIALVAACYSTKVTDNTDNTDNTDIIYILVDSYMKKKIALPDVVFENEKFKAYIRGILEDNAVYNKNKSEITHMYSRTHRLVSQYIIPDLSKITMLYLNKMSHVKIATAESYAKKYEKKKGEPLTLSRHHIESSKKIIE